jgi:hypothetical protein
MQFTFQPMLRHRPHFVLLPLVSLMTLSTSVPNGVAQPAVLSLSDKSKTVIVLPQNASLPEKTAGQDLADYLTRITGGEFTVQAESAVARTTPAIYVGATQFAKRAGINPAALPSEAWQVKTQKNSLILVGGGTRGTLYATYRFLEDNAGVRWWTPWEESVPSRRVLQLPALNKAGKPAFSYRDIYMLYGKDKGRFGIRNRLNRDGDMPIGAEYGGSREYGPPYHVHTFFKIMSPEKYFPTHPDWFIGSGDKMPTVNNAQLNMSNPEMRQEFLKLLRELIRTSHQEARKNNLPEPDVFSVSQEDNMVSFIGSEADKALVAANGGAEAAIMIDFVNFLADNIKEEFPGVYIDTLAYFSGEKAPTQICPRENVIVRLCNTAGNMLLPVTDEKNKVFRDNVIAWSKITKDLRVWLYNITFRVPSIPLPTVATYEPDLRFLREHNVDGVFTELEYPLISDMRAMKLWVYSKLLEDPKRSGTALIREFTDGYYGAAAPEVREYLAALDRAVQAKAKQSGVPAIPFGFPSLEQFTYLTRDFYVEAEEIYDRASKKVATDPVLLHRVNRARFSVDHALLMSFQNLMSEWVRAGNKPEAFPFDRSKVADRQLQAQYDEINLQLPEAERAAERNAATFHTAKWNNGPTYIPVPAKFSEVPFDKLKIYEARQTRNHADQAGVINDPQAEGGQATRYEIPETEQKMPMAWGIYEFIGRKNLLENYIKPEEVPNAGYNWYKMGDVKLENNTAYLFFSWSWTVQVDLDNLYDPQNPQQQYEVWANLKMEGPAFPHGKAEDKNALLIERLVFVKK